MATSPAEAGSWRRRAGPGRARARACVQQTGQPARQAGGDRLRDRLCGERGGFVPERGGDSCRRRGHGRLREGGGMLERALVWGGAAVLCALVAVGCGGGGAESGGGEEGRYREEIVIGWTPPDITGVFKTATDFFEQAAEDANKEGFNVKIESRSPETHTAFADQLEIIENFISQDVDVIAVSPADTEAIKPAIQRANEAGIPVIMVNLLEPQDDIEVASYIGFDNSEAASVSAYNELDYFGGPGVTGAGEKLSPKPDDYLDLEWWEKAYENAEAGSIKARGTIIEGIAGTFFSQERVDGFHEVIDKYSGIQIQGKPI